MKKLNKTEAKRIMHKLPNVLLDMDRASHVYLDDKRITKTDAVNQVIRLALKGTPFGWVNEAAGSFSQNLRIYVTSEMPGMFRLHGYFSGRK